MYDFMTLHFSYTYKGVLCIWKYLRKSTQYYTDTFHTGLSPFQTYVYVTIVAGKVFETRLQMLFIALVSHLIHPSIYSNAGINYVITIR